MEAMPARVARPCWVSPSSSRRALMRSPVVKVGSTVVPTLYPSQVVNTEMCGIALCATDGELIRVKLAGYLLERRIELGLTQKEVAVRAGGGISDQYVSDWENGRGLPGPVNFAAMV